MAEREDSPEDAEARPELKGPWWYSERRSVTDEQRRDVLSQLFYEGPDLLPFLARFAALLAMAILIALFGLARDSAPVVIGAMLISPLTTPLLGFATALVLGRPRRQLNSLLILIGASAGGIALAVAVTFLYPDPQGTTLASEELLARTDPQLLDLAVAVVAGAAGAYVLVRREAVSALPGVAIAVALVPPLTTVGMTLELGRGDLASEAFLLYLTNLAGIILAASIVMLLLGVGARPTAAGLPRSIKLGLSTAALGAVLVSVPLVVHFRDELTEAQDQDDAERSANDWIAGSGLGLDVVELNDDDSVLVRVFGAEPPPAAEPLAQSLSEQFEQRVELTVKWTPVETTTATGEP